MFISIYKCVLLTYTILFEHFRSDKYPANHTRYGSTHMLVRMYPGFDFSGGASDFSLLESAETDS